MTCCVSHCTLRVTQPREPCPKFNAAMGFNQAVRMAQSGYCGFLLYGGPARHHHGGRAFRSGAPVRGRSASASALPPRCSAFTLNQCPIPVPERRRCHTTRGLGGDA